MSINTNPFTSKNVAVTGKLTNYTRSGIHSRLLQLGAHPTSTISKHTHYIIVGSKAGSKLDKARALGVAILSECDFERMAEGDEHEDQ